MTETPKSITEDEIVAEMTAAAERAKAVPSRWRRGAAEVEAVRLTHESGPQVWEWADSKPTYGTDKFVDGLAVYTPDGRVVARFGMWVVRAEEGGPFEVWDDAAFRAWHKPADAEAARIVAEPSRAESPAPEPAGAAAAIVGAAEAISPQAHRPGPKRMLGRESVQHCYGCGRRWPCEGSWQLRAERAEAKLAEVTANLRLLAEGCLDLASNGADLDRHTSASLAYRDVAKDILAITGTEGDGRD